MSFDSSSREILPCSSRSNLLCDSPLYIPLPKLNIKSHFPAFADESCQLDEGEDYSKAISFTDLEKKFRDELRIKATSFASSSYKLSSSSDSACSSFSVAVTSNLTPPEKLNTMSVAGENNNHSLDFHSPFFPSNDLSKNSFGKNSFYFGPSGSSELLSKMYDTALEKYARTKQEFDELQRRFNEMSAINNETGTRLQMRLQEIINERDEARQSLKIAQAESAAIISQLDSNIKKMAAKREEAREAIHKSNRELERKTAERNAALAEWNRVMAERDSVHADINRLNCEVETLQDEAKKKAKLVKDERRLALELITCLEEVLVSGVGDVFHFINQLKSLVSSSESSNLKLLHRYNSKAVMTTTGGSNYANPAIDICNSININDKSSIVYPTYSHDSAINADMYELCESTEIFTITLSQQGFSGFGFEISQFCGTNCDTESNTNNSQHIYVSSINRNSEAERKLRINDVILRINSLNVRNISSLSAIRGLLHSNTSSVCLLVRRELGNNHQLPISNQPIALAQDLGVLIESAFFISYIKPGSLASKESEICVGSRLLSFNAIELKNKSPSEVKKILNENKNNDTISFRIHTSPKFLYEKRNTLSFEELDQSSLEFFYRKGSIHLRSCSKNQPFNVNGSTKSIQSGKKVTTTKHNSGLTLEEEESIAELDNIIGEYQNHNNIGKDKNTNSSTRHSHHIHHHHHHHLLNELSPQTLKSKNSTSQFSTRKNSSHSSGTWPHYNLLPQISTISDKSEGVTFLKSRKKKQRKSVFSSLIPFKSSGCKQGYHVNPDFQPLSFGVVNVCALPAPLTARPLSSSKQQWQPKCYTLNPYMFNSTFSHNPYRTTSPMINNDSIPEDSESVCCDSCSIPNPTLQNSNSATASYIRKKQRKKSAESYFGQSRPKSVPSNKFPLPISVSTYSEASQKLAISGLSTTPCKVANTCNSNDSTKVQNLKTCFHNEAKDASSNDQLNKSREKSFENSFSASSDLNSTIKNNSCVMEDMFSSTLTKHCREIKANHHSRDSSRIGEGSNQPRRPYIGEIRSISLDKSTEPLGIQIQSVLRGHGIFVCDVSEHSLAWLAGIVQGDQLLEVCGINLRNVTHAIASNVLTQCGDHIILLVQFNPTKFYQSNNFEQGQDDYAVPMSSALIHCNSNVLQPDMQLINSMLNYEKIRIVSFQKPDCALLGVNLIGGNNLGIFVKEVKENSLAAGYNGLKVGDKILEYNGVDLRTATAEQAALELAIPCNMVNIKAKFERDKFNEAFTQPGDSFYIKSHVDYSCGSSGDIEEEEAENDDNNDSKRHDPENKDFLTTDLNTSLSFCKNSILFVDNTMHEGVLGLWHAYKVNAFTGIVISSKSGVVPSKMKMEELMFISSLGERNGSKRSSSGSRRSFFRKRKKSVTLSTPSSSIYDSAENFKKSSLSNLQKEPYSLVTKFKTNQQRPLVIIGPLSHFVLEQLAKLYPGYFTLCDVEILKASKEMIMNAADSSNARGSNIFVECKQTNSYYECILLESVLAVIQSNKHCLLTVSSIDSALRMYKNSIYPIILFLNFKSHKQIKDFSAFHSFTTSSSKEVLEESKKIEADFGKLISGTLNIGSDFACVFEEIKNITYREQESVLWMPY